VIVGNWELTKGLQNLRNQVNAQWPGRDTTSDGTIGDYEHQQGTSGHNPDDTAYDNAEWDGDDDANSEVRAWDMDADLREDGVTAQMIVDHIVGLKPSSVLRYVIYNHKIYKSQNGWKPESYTGASAHTEHIHFSGAYSQSADNNTTYNYRLDEVNPMSVQNVADFFASAAAGVRGVKADGSTPADSWDRARRNDLAAIFRFAWGLNTDEQDGHNLAPARHDQTMEAVVNLSTFANSQLPNKIAEAVVSKLPPSA
jgi:hypothetical protein